MSSTTCGAAAAKRPALLDREHARRALRRGAPARHRLDEVPRGAAHEHRPGVAAEELFEDALDHRVGFLHGQTGLQELAEAIGEVELVHPLREPIARLLLGLHHARQPLRHRVEGMPHHRDLVVAAHVRPGRQVPRAHDLGGAHHLAQAPDDEDVADDGGHAEGDGAHEAQREQVAHEAAVGFGEDLLARDSDREVEAIGGRQTSDRREREEPRDAVDAFHGDAALALLGSDGLRDGLLGQGLPHPALGLGMAGEHHPGGVGDHKDGIRGQAGALGERVNPAQVHAGEEHPAHLAGGPERGPGHGQGGSPGHGLDDIAGHHDVVSGLCPKEIGLVGDADEAPQRLGRAVEIAAGGGLAEIHVDREAPTQVGEEGAAAAGAPRGRHRRYLGNPDEQGARALDEPLLVGGGGAGDA